MNKFLWAIFGNDDDPLPPADYLPLEPTWKRNMYWWLRNPGHNFTFFVVGIADKQFERKVVYPKDAPTSLVFRPEGWYIAYIEYKWLILPFISYQGKGKIKKFYLGWRERGNLGAKLTIKGD